MRYRNAGQALRSLRTLARAQGGYFTARQARAAGYGFPHLAYHVAAGNFERVEHGLYRLRDLPFSAHDDLVRWCLWSRGRDDRPQAVVSHRNALALHEIGELIPARIELIVPRTFRKRAPRGVVLHKADLAADETEERAGFRVTTPLRTLLDVAAGDATSQEQLDKAVADALEKGLVRRSKLVEAIAGLPRAQRLLLAPVLHR